ncbi:unnamed protein product [Gongylonema pulchrum]|uniref:Secreted protein n=1 Tax=Gongylonema pulchrum TaxID=637853 RepID=A0A183DYL7_9BILA|nr:unnamed protein product [Gongylonema pulchrum]
MKKCRLPTTVASSSGAVPSPAHVAASRSVTLMLFAWVAASVRATAAVDYRCLFMELLIRHFQHMRRIIVGLDPKYLDTSPPNQMGQSSNCLSCA